VLQIPRLQDVYFTRLPDYPKGITVPAIVDVPTGAVVTNDFAQMTLDLSTEWTAYHRDGAPQLYPESLRDEIDDVGKRVYTEINNGMYPRNHIRRRWRNYQWVSLKPSSPHAVRISTRCRASSSSTGLNPSNR
jgi:glutathionyl-hydroquinone reductase